MITRTWRRPALRSCEEWTKEAVIKGIEGGGMGIRVASRLRMRHSGRKQTTQIVSLGHLQCLPHVRKIN